MPVEIIGAGFGRTGTMSLKHALDDLGFECYHMMNVFEHNDTDTWLDMVHAKTKGEDYDLDGKLFQRPGGKQYRAAIDVPPMFFYKDYLKKNPNVKVILTVRDSAEVWYKSTMDTVWPHQYYPSLTRRLAEIFLPGPMRHHRQLVKALCFEDPELFAGKFEDQAFAMRRYEEWNAEVARLVPKGQLLVFNVKQGWPPLCAFLGVPVPQGMPFPRVNDTATFNARIVHYERYMMMTMLGMAAAAAGVAAGAVALLRRRQGK